MKVTRPNYRKGVALSVGFNRFVKWVVNNTELKMTKLAFKTRPEIRYTWGKASVYDLALSLKSEAYLSHQTAAYLNGLTDIQPNNIYVNSEQSRKASKGVLTQERIDLAFINSPRVTKNHAEYGGRTIWLLNGMYTGCYGVIESKDEYGEKIRLTNVERTLIDMSVRPVYAGGVEKVLRAYRLAKDKVSVDQLAETLRVLDHTYPYHQVVGFYLEKAGGYRENQIELFTRLDQKYDFYLTHNMGETSYSKKWRLYYPKNL
jgi:predicted transcriptional regulator of viral defense system